MRVIAKGRKRECIFLLKTSIFGKTFRAVSASFRKTFWLILVPVIGLMMYGALVVVDPYGFADDYYAALGWKAYCFDLVGSVASAYLVFGASVLVSRTLDRFLTWESRPALRFVAQFFTLALTSTAVMQLVVWSILKVTTPEAYQLSRADEIGMRQAIVMGVLSALAVNAVYTGEYFFRRWKTALLEAEALKRAAISSQFEALKAQLDPHFLFNNLNTLVTIIEEDPRLAVRFVEKLAVVYRYVLQHRGLDTVPLRAELDFSEAYLFLARLRFGDNLRVRFNLNGAADEARIPPLTLQILLENALKHNVVSAEKPLDIVLEEVDDRLVVRNKFQPKSSREPSTGLGLQNIADRYRHLGAAAPEVAQTGVEFVVKLPLLQKW